MRPKLKLQLAPAAVKGCRVCTAIDDCGGLDQQAIYGCFWKCNTCGVEDGKCDYTCPRKSDYFMNWADIGGPNMKQNVEIPGFNRDLPRYIPMIPHGSMRARPIRRPWVAVSTHDVVGARGSILPRSAESLRQKLCVRPETNLLLVSVKEDDRLEAFWRSLDPEKLRGLLPLKIGGVTTPNFSIFDDAPRTHTIRNLWRTLRSGEALVEAEVAPLVHMNAVCPEDWRWWTRFLQQNPNVRHICKEFQTGLSNPAKGAEALQHMRRLQDELKRPLHPVLIGGRKHLHRASQGFDNWTLVDSTPFFATVFRKELTLNSRRRTASQKDAPTIEGQTLDRLLRKNLGTYEQLVSISGGKDIVRVDAEVDELHERGQRLPRAALDSA